MEFHIEQLQKCCRVCGKRLKNAKGVGRSFSCTNNSKLLQEVFKLDVSQDDSEIHPLEYCFACHGVIRRKLQADRKGVPYRTNAIANQFQWHKHKEECEVK